MSEIAMRRIYTREEELIICRNKSGWNGAEKRGLDRNSEAALFALTLINDFSILLLQSSLLETILPYN